MKTQKFVLAIALLSASLSQTSSAVTPSPLANPQGLAVDSKGNLYVANPGHVTIPEFNFGQVLVYGPNHAQLTAKSIAKVGFNPWAVAVNSKDQIYVADFYLSTVTKYTGKVQDTTKTKTIADGILNPNSIGIDGMDNVWVADHGNGNTKLDVFSDKGLKLNSILMTEFVDTLAVPKKGSVLFTSGDDIGTRSGSVAEILTGKSTFSFYEPGFVAKTSTIDQNGVYFAAEFNGDLAFSPDNGASWHFLVHLPYAASGIAIDNQRKWIYVSSDNLNQIDVYTTRGTYVTTIH